MRRTVSYLLCFSAILLFGLLQGCATHEAPSVHNSLPQEILARYTDPFDTFRTDLWERAALFTASEQAKGFKRARFEVQDGKLHIRARKGGFSQGGLGSRYLIRGDFHIRIACRFEMRHILFFMNKTAVEAKHPVHGIFDGFRIEAAREIVESEI